MKFNRARNKTIGGIFIFIMMVAFVFGRPNFYLEGPGTAEPTSNFVKVDGKTDKKKGNLLLTTVAIRPATPFFLLKAMGDDFETITPKEELMGNESNAEYNQIQQYYMQSATNAAVAAAYSKAGKPYKSEYLGVYIMEVAENSDFKNKLKIGDTVTEVNGYHFNSSEKFINYVKKLDKNDKVTIKYTRDGKNKTAKGGLVKLEGTKRYGVGITLTDNTKVTATPPTKIDAGDIGGPSAGLMFTLQVYSQIANVDLKDGRTIAGTGTIDSDGNVGPIGGIDKKVYAASHQGATIFFAPDDPVTKEIKKYDPNYVNNYNLAKQAAKKLNTKMKIVPVKTLDDAINYLNKTK
ncbi:SepM family pheromone-processing serine protease [Companilactobacillus metriopterae]|uniref:SepM family pheromone-processing serine protease n=1 Tax=Companilactobacillus metriopterae TaxID=1909267 RepID=UPI00100BFBA4|nr:SepM family pheromone-processing serine protease [Companilactobacillus metriopterae]